MAESSSPSAPAGGTSDYVPPKKSGRLLVTVLAVLIATNAVTAVATYYVAQPPPTAAAPVRVIGPWGGAEKDKFLPVLNLFKNQTGINFEFITTRQENLQLDLPNWFAARRSPGDLIFMPSAYVKLYGTQGHAVDLTGTITQTNYQAGALDPLKDGSKLYGGAYTGKVKPGFWYKQSLFTANSLSPPTTWAQFESLLQALDGIVPNQPIISGDGVGWPLSDVAEHFLATYGGPSMHRGLMAGTTAWTSTPVRDVFANRLVRTLDGTVCGGASCWSAPRQWDTGVTEWWNGDYGLYFMGSWITGMGTASAPGPALNPSDIRVFSLPEAPGTTGIVFAADYFFVPTYASNLDGAKRLAAFLGSSPAQTQQVKVGGHVATVTGVAASAYPAVDAMVAGLLTGKEVLSDLDDTKGQPFQGVFWSELQGLWANPGSLDTRLANIQAAA